MDKGEVKIKHCPTDLMLADYFTKPLQGKIFHIYRDIIMGYKPITDLLSKIELKERVENQDFKKVSSTSQEMNHVRQEMNHVRNLKKEKTVKGKLTYRDALVNQP